MADIDSGDISTGNVCIIPGFYTVEACLKRGAQNIRDGINPPSCSFARDRRRSTAP